MNIRRFDKTKDYSEISSWWLQHGWSPVSLDLLPETGYIVDGYCAGFLYKTDSKFGILEFVISNPNSDNKIRSESLDLLIDSLLNSAKEVGCSTIFSSLEHPRLINKYKNHGFKVTDKNMTNLIRIL